jgi:predicted tellurium resistance membrane protein TerC
MFKLTVKNQTEKVALADIPALRQSFAGASILIIIGVALAINGSMWFLILPAMVSVGLLFSSLAGWCPMAMIMEKMPWNKK